MDNLTARNKQQATALKQNKDKAGCREGGHRQEVEKISPSCVSQVKGILVGLDLLSDHDRG